MRILIAGDFCPGCKICEIIDKGEFENIFGDVTNIIAAADYSIVNLESPVVERKAGGIRKYGPHLKCGRRAIEALKWAGFDCVTLANNHFMDYGVVGAEDTIRTLDAMGFDKVGAGMNNREAANVLYKQIQDKTLAIVNCCEHEFSIAGETKPGCNGLEPVRQYYDIKEARRSADYVLVIVHGGHEQWQLPSPRMQETYRFFIDAGADAVVNHHQHCYSGYEKYNDKFIFYGLGNFCFELCEMKEISWSQGYMVVLDFENKDFEIIPYDQCGKKLGITLLEQGTFDQNIGELNKVINSKKALSRMTDDFFKGSMTSIRSILNPVQNRWIKGAMSRGWIPDCISEEWLVSIENYISCESHRDKLEYFLRNNE